MVKEEVIVDDDMDEEEEDDGGGGCGDELHEVEALIAKTGSLELSDCYHWSLCLGGCGNAKRYRNG